MSRNAERRLGNRFLVRLPGVYRPGRSRQGTPPAGYTVEVGPGGLRLRTRRQPDLIQAGDTIYVQIGRLRDRPSITVEGRVRWLKPVTGPKDELDIGVGLLESELTRWGAWLLQTADSAARSDVKSS